MTTDAGVFPASGQLWLPGLISQGPSSQKMGSEERHATDGHRAAH